jgi:hypothetical protein
MLPFEEYHSHLNHCENLKSDKTYVVVMEVTGNLN